MTKFLTILYLLFISATFSFAQTIEPDHLIMGAPRAEKSIYGQIIKMVYDDAFKRLGIEYIYRGCVPDKCGEYVTEGAFDGEMARVIEYNEKFPELIRVKEPVFTINMSAFSEQDITGISNWESLISSPYSIAYVEGYYKLEKLLMNKINKKRAIPVSSYIEGLDKLQKKEADIYIGVEGTVMKEISKGLTRVKKIAVLDSDVEVYCFMNKKHKTLAIELSATFRQMQKDGTFKKIHDKLAELLAE